MNRETDAPPLLRDDELPPFETLRGGTRPVVFVCDHASNRIPAALHDLGLEDRHLRDHIAWDIGAAAVARNLTEWFEAVGVHGCYSRLVVDLNRSLRDSSAFAEISDGVLVPGNLGLSPEAKAARARTFHKPYHEAVRRTLDGAATAERRPVMIAVHSFTPRLSGIERPWHVGVLWDKDPRLPIRLMHRLRAGRDVVVGDNEPYSGRHPADFTIDHHAESLGIAHVSLEIRQDLIRDETGQTRWSERLADALRDVLDDAALYRPPGTVLAAGAAGARAGRRDAARAAGSAPREVTAAGAAGGPGRPGTRA